MPSKQSKETSDFKKHTDYLISYYDKGKTSDKKYTSFMARMHQQNNESVQIFRQRFDETTTELIEAGSLISYESNPDAHNKQQADLFISKLNTYTRDCVHEQLAKKDKTLLNPTLKKFMTWL